MASSNVDYYQKQKDLQDKMHASERRRLQLEAQLQSYCHSDEKLAKLRAVKLQSYWKKICDDEKRSRQRNAQLLRDLDRMEGNMANLEARREKLRHLKQQYWDYIDRAYPHWLELVQQQHREKELKQEEQQHKLKVQQQQQKQQQQQRFQQQQQQQHEAMMQQEHERQMQYEQQERLQQERTQQQEQQERLQKQQQQRQQNQYQQPARQQQQYQQPARQQQPYQQTQMMPQEQEEEDEEAPPPLPTSPPPTLAFSNGYTENYRVPPEREYSNLKDISRQPPSSAPKQPTVASVTVHMPENPQGEFNTPVIQRRETGGRKMDQQGQNWLGAERDPSVQSVSFSEEVSVPIIQPVQSVTVRQKQTEQKLPPTTAPPGAQSDEDVSDFGDDVELPSEAVPPPLPEHMKPSPSPPYPEQETQVKQVLAESDLQDQEPESLSSVHPELSSQGLMRLLKYVEADIGDALSVEGYYRTRNPDTSQRKEIIYKANTTGTLQGLDAEYVSMVVLEQLTPVIRNLPGACILPDTVLIRSATITSESQLRAQLHRDAQGLWDKLLEHFICLVKNRAMGTREVAYVFVPCLAHDSSQYQDKAVSLVEQVIEQLVNGADPRAMSPLQQDSMVDTARSSQQNGVDFLPRNLAVVPPLKFGSLVDSKPFSDEESSMITQSMPTEGPKVPLNETEAYKSLVSGSMGAKRPQPTMISDDTDDNSDNDLEKQFVSTLSPRSHASTGNVIPESDSEQPAEPAKSSEKMLSESHDQSADQEPPSEISELLGTAVYVPTGVDRRAVERSTARSALGSTGGSSQQRRLAGMISSDIDTDTEVDLDKMGTKKLDNEDDDDFHDFYQ